MEANELRMGNWLKRLDNTLFQVTGNDIHSMDDLPDYLKPHPIPLTEEWLLKFGFEKGDDYGDQIYYDKGKYTVCFDHEDLVFYKNNKGDLTCLIYDEEHFQHVHHLQNLWFFITGEELTINTNNQ